MHNKFPSKLNYGKKLFTISLKKFFNVYVFFRSTSNTLSKTICFHELRARRRRKGALLKFLSKIGGETKFHLRVDVFRRAVFSSVFCGSFFRSPKLFIWDILPPSSGLPPETAVEDDAGTLATSGKWCRIPSCSSQC